MNECKLAWQIGGIGNSRLTPPLITTELFAFRSRRASMPDAERASGPTRTTALIGGCSSEAALSRWMKASDFRGSASIGPSERLTSFTAPPMSDIPRARG